MKYGFLDWYESSREDYPEMSEEDAKIIWDKIVKIFDKYNHDVRNDIINSYYGRGWID